MENLLGKCDEASAFLKLLANRNRLAVLCTLPEAPCCINELAVRTGMPQAATSSQPALLREAGIVTCEVRHRQRLYHLADARVRDTIALPHGFFCAQSASSNPLHP